MDIGKKVYQDLTPKQRAVACYLALKRDDDGEADRLFRHAPRCKIYKQEMFALGQALDAYNFFIARAIRDFLVVSGQLKEMLSFCEAWVAAGGSIDNSMYSARVTMVEKLLPLMEEVSGEVKAIRQAAWEWCKKYEIPTDFFSGPDCFSPLPKEKVEQSDSEILNVVRSLFDKITLTW